MTVKFISGASDCCIPFTVIDPGSGELRAPDATPTVVIRRSGFAIDDVTSTISPAIETFAAGRYAVRFDAPAFSEADQAQNFWVEVTAVVDGVSYTRIVGTFQVEPSNLYFEAVADGGNTATSFKTNLAEATNDRYKGSLISSPRTTGEFAGEIRKITAYNGTTKFITLDSALTGTPAGGEVFELISR